MLFSAYHSSYLENAVLAVASGSNLMIVSFWVGFMLLSAVDVMETMVQRWGEKALTLLLNLQKGFPSRI